MSGAFFVLHPTLYRTSCATEFAPEQTMRAETCSILARLENVTSAESAGFSDVSDEWYATAVNWARSLRAISAHKQ